MNWHNLDKNKCPQCSADLAPSYNVNIKKFICPCGFQIYEERFKEIIDGRGKDRFRNEKHYRPEDENPE